MLKPAAPLVQANDTYATNDGKNNMRLKWRRGDSVTWWRIFSIPRGQKKPFSPYPAVPRLRNGARLQAGSALQGLHILTALRSMRCSLADLLET